MANTSSLGLHEPSALQYLVSEGILPLNPATSSYTWQYERLAVAGSYVVDEVLRTVACVVWSRNGIVKRVFDLDIEGESISHAFTTSFRPQEPLKSRDSDAASYDRGTKEQALVVLLKSQAHIFLLSGDTLVVPLAFEVERAIPAAFGFFLQRAQLPNQLHKKSETADGVRLTASATDANHDTSVPSQTFPPSATTVPTKALGQIFTKLPRTFAFPELLAELNLVVSGSARKPDPIEACPILSIDEDIIYVSTNDELHEIHTSTHGNVYLAVTFNAIAKALTFWQVVFKNNELDDTAGKQQNEGTGHKSKRKSSNVYGRQTGATTPSVRGPGPPRESIGRLAQPGQGNGVFAFANDVKSSMTSDLAAQLGHEFEQVGVQTRSARRVSSMLARTDLGAANDRSAFNEVVPGAIGRKSFGRSIKRGESLGGFSDRQSFGVRRRSSFQAASSVYSDGTSFLDLHASQLLDNGTGIPGLETLDEFHDMSTGGRMPRNVAFLKLKSIPYDVVNQNNDTSKSFKVVTLLAPDRSTADDRRSRIISVCVMDTHRREMTIVNIAARVSLSAGRNRVERSVYDLKAVEVQRGQSIVDACSVVEDGTKRLLILTQTMDGRSVLHLEAPWSASYRISLPARFKVFDPVGTGRGDSPVSARETGIRRIIPESEVKIKGVQTCGSGGQVLALDADERWHHLRIRLLPSHSLTRKVLRLCNLVLAPEFFDSILVAWWEVKRWIDLQGSEPNLEWTALVVTIFVLAVPFVSNLQARPAQGPKRKKGGLLRSSSGVTIDLSHWDLMQEMARATTPQVHDTAAAWAWLDAESRHKTEPKSPGKHSRTASMEVDDDSKANGFLIRCINFARDFLQSPAGESATGPEGYLPIAVNKDRSFRRTALATVLIGLHLLREELKLHHIATDVLDESCDELAAVIAQIGSWLDWKDWCARPGKYYHTEIIHPRRWVMETSVIDTLEVPAQPFTPPSIFKYVQRSILAQDAVSFPSLLDLLSQTKAITQTHPLWKEAVQITPRLFTITAFMAHFNQKRSSRSVIKYMLSCGIDRQFLNTIPVGIAAVCHQAILTVRGKSAANWPKETKALLGRADLDIDENAIENRTGEQSLVSYAHHAVRDFRSISNIALETDSVSRWDVFSEVDRQAITKLIFHEDRRFQEASKLVNQTRPPLVECAPEAGWSEADLLEAQKELAVHVTRRTLSVAAGRAMMHFSARVPLLTERVPIPAFSLQCVMKPGGNNDNGQPMTLSADKALFTEDKVCWAFFHNGASAGLMISRDTRWIDTSWILYNKPPELTNRHAGFLLALGLNGHLKSLAKWVAFKYLTPKHTMTSVGLLLGLAASYLGTMDTLIARLLSVHVTRLLPIGAAELNLSPLTQTTGILGVGLLYYNSQHRRMSEIMLSEIENSDVEDRSGDEPILRDEGYRLAAGFSLGLINLARGADLRSLHDMNVTERLLTIAISTKNVNMVHVLDRATAGAVIAVAFIFMKTNEKTIAEKIDVPDTMHQFDYVRPDIFLLRTLARHLIMWDSIVPTREFIQNSLPVTFRRRADLSTTKRLSTDDLPFFNVVAGICFATSLRFAGSHSHEARNLLVSFLDQFMRLSKLPALNYDAKVTLNGVRNCLDVLALSCATVMAGSGDIAVMRRLRALHGRTDKETPFGSHLAAHMALGVLFLSGGTASFGTSNLAIAALVISLYPLFPVDVLDNSGHLQALRHLWVLAVENRCLTARDVGTQQVISDIDAEVELTDGRVQMFKTPCLLPEFDQIKKVGFRHEGYWPVHLDFDGFANIPSTGAASRLLDKKTPLTVREHLKSRGTGIRISLQRRTTHEKPDTDVFFTELQALDENRGIPSTDADAMVNEKWRQAHGYSTNPDTMRQKPPFEWIFSLNTMKCMDFREKALVLDNPQFTSGTGRSMLQETAVDSILDLELSCLGVDDEQDMGGSPEKYRKILPKDGIRKDQLWQLRLLFEWIDRGDREDAEDKDDSDRQDSVRWIKDEVVEHLRSRIWKMAGGEQQ